MKWYLARLSHWHCYYCQSSLQFKVYMVSSLLTVIMVAQLTPQLDYRDKLRNKREIASNASVTSMLTAASHAGSSQPHPPRNSSQLSVETVATANTAASTIPSSTLTKRHTFWSAPVTDNNGDPGVFRSPTLHRVNSPEQVRQHGDKWLWQWSRDWKLQTCHSSGDWSTCMPCSCWRSRRCLAGVCRRISPLRC